MIDFILWLIAIEVIGILSIPLAVAGLPWLPDRGIGLSKVLGLLVLTFINYLLGSTVGLANNPIVLIVIFVLLAGGVGWLLRSELRVTLSRCRKDWLPIAVGEILFLVLFIIWSLFRAAHPAILSTEKPMDLAMLTASQHATTMPPYDPWLAGTNINYYYGGYLAVGTMGTLVNTASPIAYNLGLALLFALVGLSAYSVTYNLTRRVLWSLCGPLFVVLIGNLNGIWQILNVGPGGFNFFASSRVVEPTQCGGSCTITEFPQFSFALGDLHPHVSTLVFTLLAIGVAINLALAPKAGWRVLVVDLSTGKSNTPRKIGVLLLAALATGDLYMMNSWDWPTYTVLIGAALVVPAVATRSWALVGEAVGLAIAIAVTGYVLYFQFHANFHPQYNSFGLKAHNSPLGDVLTMFGLPLVVIVLMMVTEIVNMKRTPSPARPIRPDGDDGLTLPMPSLNTPTGLLGAALFTWLVVFLAFKIVGIGTIGFFLPLFCCAVFFAWHYAQEGENVRSIGFLLCAGGFGLIMLCDMFYLKDNFCGGLDTSGGCTGNLYRMNTVFKFYYQAWTLLALGAAVATCALAARWRGAVSRFAVPIIIGMVTILGGEYTVSTIFTTTTQAYTTANMPNAPLNLDGSAYLASYAGPSFAAIPSSATADARAIAWIHTHISGHPTIAEAEYIPPGGGPQDYWPYPGRADQSLLMGRISTFTGLATIVGSGYSHEGLWHTDALVGQRVTDVKAIYTSADMSAVRRLVNQYHVAYIYLGQVEQDVYYSNSSTQFATALQRLKTLGQVAYQSEGVSIVRVTAV